MNKISEASLKVNEELLLRQLSECRKTLNWPHSQFLEQGGALIGFFDGDWKVTRFVMDEDAISSPGHIQFSSSFFLNLNSMLETYESILGTWHTHPSSYGTYYSETDYRSLFHDSMLLKAGRPVSLSPRVHLICDIDRPQNSKAFTLQIQTEYDLKPLEAESVVNLAPPINEDRMREIAFLSMEEKESKWICYTDLDNLEDSETTSLAGLFKKYKAINDRHRNTILENYFLKTGHESFLYCEQVEDNAPLWYEVERLGEIHNARRLVEYVEVTLAYEEHFKTLVATQEGTTIAKCSEKPSLLQSVGKLTQAMAEKLGIKKNELIPLCLHRPDLERSQYPQLVFNGSDVLIPDDWTVEKVICELADFQSPDIAPIRFLIKNLSDELVYAARVSRLVHCGYNVNKLKSSKVVIGGVGILGCEIAQDLATAGVGHLSLIDSGYVDIPNLRRQCLFGQEHYMHNKAEAAASVLCQYGGITVEGHNFEIPAYTSSSGFTWTREAFGEQWSRLLDCINGASLIVAVFDKTTPRLSMQVAAALLDIPFLQAGIAAMGGSVDYWHPSMDFGCLLCKSEWRPRQEGALCTVASLELKKVLCANTLEIARKSLETDSEAIADSMPENSVQLRSENLQSEHFKRLKRPTCKLCGTDGILTHFKSDPEKAGQALYDVLYQSE